MTVIFILLAIIAVIMNFMSKRLSEIISKKDEPDEKLILKIKVTALLIAAFDFILVLILL